MIIASMRTTTYEWQCPAPPPPTDCKGQCCPTTTQLGSSGNYVSGNLYHDQTLFQTPNSKLPSDFTIAYNSLDTYTGPLGKGWTHSFNINITKESNNTITLMKQDGKRVNFTYSGGSYYSDVKTGERSVIVASTDKYTLTAKDGTVYTFNTKGKLTNIKDRNNNTTTLSYTGDDLAGITDSSGRQISIVIGSGKITSVTDTGGRTWTFAYSGNSLASVTVP